MSEETSDIILDTQTPVSKWAPIIYGRTYAVDFRFLVIPHNFDDQFKDSLWEYIKVTTRGAENLPENPRWIFIRSKQRCVVGVTCMVRDLIGSQAGNTPEDLTRDKLGRPLYVFVGYVSEDPMTSIIPAMNLELFADPYKEFVPQKWQEVYADLGRNQAAPQELKSEYDIEFSPENLATEDLREERISIEQLLPNRQGKETPPIIFWNIANASNIWFTAAKNHQPLSIGLGKLSKRDLIDSCFMNAVINEVEDRKEETRIQSVSPQQPSPQPPEKPFSGRNLEPLSGQFGNRDLASTSGQHGNNPLIDAATSLYVETTTSLSEIARGGIEFIGGEDEARKVDEFMIKNIAPVARKFLSDEVVDEMCSRVAKVDEWEQRLNAVIQDNLAQLYQLEEERKELLTQGRNAQADVKAQEKSQVRQKINALYNKLTEIKKLIPRKQGRLRLPERSRQSGQVNREVQTDINLGFKEKEQSVENEAKDRRESTENNPPKSKDLWEL